MALLHLLLFNICATSAANEGVVRALVGVAAFDAFVEENRFVFVALRPRWCCADFGLAFDAAAQTFGSIHPELLRVAFATVDVTVEMNADLVRRFDATIFPTILFVQGGHRVVDYDGDPSNAAMVEWASHRVPRRYGQLRNFSELERFRQRAWDDGRTAVVIGAHAAATAMDEVATSGAPELAVAQCVNDSAAALLLGDSVPLEVALFRPPHESDGGSAGGSRFITAAARNSSALGALASWVRHHARAPVLDYRTSDDAATVVFGSGTDNVVVVFSDPASEGHDELQRAVLGAALRLRGEAVFVRAGATEASLLQLFALSAAQLPAVRLHRPAEPASGVFAYDRPMASVSATALVDFCERAQRGAVPPVIKSDPPPSAEEQSASDVRTLVGTTFWDAALAPSTDTLVLFFAPWCARCEKIAPAFAALAATFAAVDSVQVASIDDVANEPNGIEVDTFPTIQLWPAGGGAADAVRFVEHQTFKRGGGV